MAGASNREYARYGSDKRDSGKSTFAALTTAALERRGYEIMVQDRHVSYPKRLVRLLSGLGIEAESQPLIHFFGGIARVTRIDSQCGWDGIIDRAQRIPAIPH